VFHKQSKFSRRAGLGLLTVATVGAGLLAAPAAEAAVTGTVTMGTHTGFSNSAFDVIASHACSGGTAVKVVVSGGTGTNAFPAGALAVGLSNQSLYTPDPTTGGLRIPLSNHMDALAQANGITIQPGKYTFDILCVNNFGPTVYDDFQGSIWFTSTTLWQDTDPSAATPTSIGLTANPPSPSTAGTPVTFTAALTPSNAAGSVQFTDNGAPTGAPVAVAGGTAAYTTPSLTAGSHSIGATFTPAAGFLGSTAGAITYVVNPGAVTPTTTNLAVNPSGTTVQNTPVTLTATVAPSAAAGKVQFSDNGAPIGQPTTPDNLGVATLTTSTLGVGAHSFTAAFTATNSAVYGNSASAAIALAVTAPQAPTATETITTTVLPGALVISVPDGQVTLPSPVLNNAGDMFTTSGALKPVTVTDNRAGNPGWTVNGQVSDFSDSASHAINGQNLGWTPNVVDHSGAQTLTLGGAVAPANGVAPTDTGALGLKGSHALATAASGAGLGTAHLAAALALNVPTTTVAGTYVATLTLTAI
jgi:hypothetical protein